MATHARKVEHVVPWPAQRLRTERGKIGRAMRYPLTRGMWELASRKAVGEAISFPYRLIANHFLAFATGEAPVSGAAAVTEFDAVPL